MLRLTILLGILVSLSLGDWLNYECKLKEAKVGFVQVDPLDKDFKKIQNIELSFSTNNFLILFQKPKEERNFYYFCDDSEISEYYGIFCARGTKKLHYPYIIATGFYVLWYPVEELELKYYCNKK
jgi:hypothetical protein